MLAANKLSAKGKIDFWNATRVPIEFFSGSLTAIDSLYTVKLFLIELGKASPQLVFKVYWQVHFLIDFVRRGVWC